MTEKKFIQQNIEIWEELEELLMNSHSDPDRIHELFVKVSSDLSYARTFFPNRSVRVYLNQLTQKVFNKMATKNRKLGLSSILHFFKHTLPLEIYRSRKSFYVSLIVFVLAFSIGVLSSANQPKFATIILGEDYISMTQENINKGDPMAVYKDADQVDMFFGITFNNIRVAFMAFVLGFIASIGTLFVLIYNGIMVGAFQYYFYSKGLFLTSFLTIWIHGTIEISAIIIAGAAGLILGRGLLLPGTLRRSSSLQISSLRALRIIIGTIPLFIIAGILESFVTRLTEMPFILKVFIIGGSLIFILFMWVFYPWYYSRNLNQIDDLEIIPQETKSAKEKMSYRNFEENLALTISQYRSFFSGYVRKVILPMMFLVGFWVWSKLIQRGSEYYELDNPYYFGFSEGGIEVFALLWFGLSIGICIISYLYYIDNKEEQSLLQFIKQYFVRISILTLVYVAAIYFIENNWLKLLSIFVITPQWIVVSIYHIVNHPKVSFISSLIESYSQSWKMYVRQLPNLLLISIFYLLLRLLSVSGLASFLRDLVSWHEILTARNSYYFIEHLFLITIILLIIPFAFYLMSNYYYSRLCRDRSYDLEERFKKFGKNSSIFEQV